MQLALAIKTPRIALPMVDMAGAFAILGSATESQIGDLVDFGWVWAWNVGDSTSRRRNLRFLAASVAMLQGFVRETGGDIDALLASDDLPKRSPAWSDVLRLVLPKHDKPFFSGSECKRALNLRRVHFINLVNEGQLPGTKCHKGPGGTPSIARADFINFLESRVIGKL